MRKKEKFKVTEKLHQDRYDRDYIKAKVARAKEIQEEDEAIELCHMHSDKHVYNYDVRTVDQFIDDQIYFERRKLDRIRDLQDEKEIIEDTLHPLRPEINPTSQKIIDYKKQMIGDSFDYPADRSMLETMKTNGIQKKQERAQQILEERARPYQDRPEINKKSKKINRNMQDILDDTERHMIQKDMLEQNLKRKAKTGDVQINSRSDKVMHDRFDADFNNVCIDLGIIQDDFYSPSTLIDCPQMSQIFLKLGFVSAVSQEKEQLYLADIWRHVGGDDEGQG